MTNLTALANSGSAYEQLISSVLAIEGQPRLKLRASQTEQGVYKGILSDYASKISALDSVVERLTDPLRAPFAAKSATVSGSDAGFTASATDAASPGRYDVEVRQLARADARLSRRVDNDGSTLAARFTDPGDPGGPLGVPAPTPDTVGERTFKIRVAQPDGADPVEIEVAYTPSGEPGEATDREILAGIADAIAQASAQARSEGRLADGTGVSASIVSESDGTSRLSLRSEATGYDNRLTFDDPDGVLADLEVDRTAVRSGTGGGAVVAVGTSAEDSGLSAALTIDGLDVVRGTNTIDDVLEGVTLTLDAASDGPATLDIGTDAKGIRSDVKSFVDAVNGLNAFIRDKSAIDPEAGTRGVFASDTSVRGLRTGLRGDLARPVGDGAVRSLADIGITAERDGTLTIDDAVLRAAIADSPDAVGALFTAEDGLAARIADRTAGLTGATGSIEQRKDAADDRIARLDDRIERFDARLARREDSLRAQFALLQEISTRAQGQQAALASLYFF